MNRWTCTRFYCHSLKTHSFSSSVCSHASLAYCAHSLVFFFQKRGDWEAKIKRTLPKAPQRGKDGAGQGGPGSTGHHQETEGRSCQEERRAQERWEEDTWSWHLACHIKSVGFISQIHLGGNPWKMFEMGSPIQKNETKKTLRSEDDHGIIIVIAASSL